MTLSLQNTRGSLWIVLGMAAIGLAFVAWQRNRVIESTPEPPTTESPVFPDPAYSETNYLNAGSEVQYIGSSACGKCHRENEQSYLLTPHSRAFTDVSIEKEPRDGAFEHIASGRSYRVYRKDGQLHHEEIMRTSDGKEVTHLDFPVRYLVGSGHFSRTYLIEVDGFLHESPITWYASKQKWDMSPGYDARQHWGFERAAEIRCLACHAGRVEEDGAVHRMIFHEKAIGCENCHGPGSLHRARHSDEKKSTEDDFTIVHPRKASRPIEESICAACHDNGVASIELRGRRGGEFKPGRPLSDYRIHYRFTGDNNQMNVVGHVEQLQQSACYKKSERLTCVTCHDPHRREAVKDKAEFYREICQSCHVKQPCKLDSMERIKKENNNCTACHMPRGDTDIPHIAFTHHRIGLQGAKSTQVMGGKVPELVAIGDPSHLSELDRQRNLGLAYAEVYRNPQYAQFADIYRKKARENLEAVYAAGLRDPEAMTQLAEMYTSMNDFTRANQLASQVLSANNISFSVRARSLLVLADAERQIGDLSSAITQLEEATRLRRSDDNWRILGMSYLENNQPDKALPALKNALAIRPYQPDTQFGLAEIYRLQGNLSLSNEYRAKALWLLKHKQN